MSDLDLKKLHDLCEAATPGPWSWDGVELDGGEWACDPVLSATCSPCGWSGCSGARAEVLHQDVEFIAAARTALPQLLDEVETLRAEVERWKQRYAMAERETHDKHVAGCDALRAEVGRLKRLSDAQRRLLICYRLGRRPPESVLKAIRDNDPHHPEGRR